MNKTIEELEKEVEKIKEALEELKQNGQTEWKPKYEEEYYYIDLDCMTIDFAIWYNDSCDIAHLKHKVIFKTEQEAEEYFDYLQVKEKAMNEFSQEEWKNGEIDKYYIYFDAEDNNFNVSRTNIGRRINDIYFRTEKDAQAFINKYEKQIKRDMGIC